MKNWPELPTKNGFTIMEVVIYICLLCFVIFAGYQFYSVTICRYRIESVKAALFQDLRTAVSIMSNDIRLCGCDPLNMGQVGFVNETDNKDRHDTDSNSIHITFDSEYPWDGKAASKNETVIYFLYPQGGGLYKLGRCTGNSRRPQPVAENILSLHFRYFDLSEQEMSDPPSPLKSIGSVEINITAQSQDINPISNAKDRLWFQTRVRVPNNTFR